MVASIASLGNSRWAIWSAASLSVPVSRPPLASLEPSAAASMVTPTTTVIQANRTAQRRRWQKVATRSIMPVSVKEQARSAHPAGLPSDGGVIPRAGRHPLAQAIDATIPAGPGVEQPADGGGERLRCRPELHLAADPLGADQTGRLQRLEMLDDRLAGERRRLGEAGGRARPVLDEVDHD